MGNDKYRRQGQDASGTPRRRRRHTSKPRPNNRTQQAANPPAPQPSAQPITPATMAQHKHSTTRPGQAQSKSNGARGSRPKPRHPQARGTAQSAAKGTARLSTRDEISAGGVVFSGLAEAVDRNNKVDLSKIYVAIIGRLDRRGRILWSIPKGHVENGEDIVKTAEREVWEETGVYGEVFDTLGVIDYWFVSDGVRIHKTVHHHLLRYIDGELNDEDPEVTEVAWIPANELTEHFAYADERKLARKIYRTLPAIARAEKAAGRHTPRP